MPKLALSDAKLRSLSPPEKGQRDFWDTALKGFGVRVSQGGSKTFILNIDNSRRSLGRYGVISLAEARDAAKRVLAERTLGHVRPQQITFPQARDTFLAEKTATRRPKTVAGLRRFLTLYYPYQGSLSAVNHTEVERRMGKITAPSEKNHAIAASKVFFNWCVKKRYLTDNPCSGLSLTTRASRKRILTEAELKAVWIACSDETNELPAHFRLIVKLLMCTGQRRGEISALCTAYYSHTEQTVRLPGELTKNHREHTFPIGTLAAAMLHPLVASASERHATLLFTARKRTTPFNGWSKAKRQLDELSGVTGWTLHDLRRTFKTTLSRLKVPPYISERLLNHVSARGDLEDTYDLWTYLPDMRDAVEKWEAHLATVLA